MNQVIHIGFSKSASTFLQSIFSSASDINYIYKSGRFSIFDNKVDSPTLSESLLNFESDEHIVLPEWHPRLNRVRVTRIEPLEQTFAKIKENAPGSKIILVLRNQYSMIVSRYSQYVVGSGGRLNFEDFLIQMLGDDGGQNFYENYYHRIVMMLEKYFGRENILTLFYEDIKYNSEGVLKQVCEFSQHDFTNLSPSFKSKRQGLSKQGLSRVRKLNKFLVAQNQPKVEEVKTRVPKLVYDNIVRSVRLIDTGKGGGKITLPDHLKGRLYEHFHDDNLKLSSYFNRDLSQLGYL